MKKKKTFIIFIVITLMISSMIITDRIRFNNKKTPIFAVRIIPAHDVDIYTGYVILLYTDIKEMYWFQNGTGVVCFS